MSDPLIFLTHLLYFVFIHNLLVIYFTDNDGLVVKISFSTKPEVLFSSTSVVDYMTLYVFYVFILNMFVKSERLSIFVVFQALILSRSAQKLSCKHI